jgi:hypothetical protein
MYLLLLPLLLLFLLLLLIGLSHQLPILNVLYPLIRVNDGEMGTQ